MWNFQPCQNILILNSRLNFKFRKLENYFKNLNFFGIFFKNIFSLEKNIFIYWPSCKCCFKYSALNPAVMCEVALNLMHFKSVSMSNSIIHRKVTERTKIFPIFSIEPSFGPSVVLSLVVVFVGWHKKILSLYVVLWKVIPDGIMTRLNCDYLLAVVSVVQFQLKICAH